MAHAVISNQQAKPHNPRNFSFRDHLLRLGVTKEADIQDHFLRVQRIETLSGVKLRLDRYDPFTIEEYST